MVDVERALPLPSALEGADEGGVRHDVGLAAVDAHLLEYTIGTLPLAACLGTESVRAVFRYCELGLSIYRCYNPYIATPFSCLVSQILEYCSNWKVKVGQG